MSDTETWPDGTPKSMNNAFNWRNTAATAVPYVGGVNPRSLDMHSNGNVYTYTRAKKINNSTPPPPPRLKGSNMFTIKKQ